jgi:hypothetical protein
MKTKSMNSIDYQIKLNKSVHWERTRDLTNERKKDIREAYKKTVASLGEASKYMSKSGLITMTINSPAKRFYVDDIECKKIIVRAHRGFEIALKSKNKRAMYEEILRRFEIKIKETPKRSIYEIIDEIIYSEAPCFYVELSYIQNRKIL